MFRARTLAPILLLSGLGCQAELTTPLPPSKPPGSECSPTPLPFPTARLLTRSEYRRTVFDLLHTSTDPTAGFPAEPEVNGFNNNAESYRATPVLVEALRKAAQALASEAETGLDSVVACGELDEGSCAEYFVSQFGPRAFRRPLEQDEHDRFISLYEAISAQFGHSQGLTAVIEAALLSPQFLYRIESPLEGASTSDSKLGRPLGPYELASRLSYLVWGSMPDEALFAAAASGKLATPAGLEEEARRLLASPQAAERTSEFHALWLGSERLKSLMKNDAPPEAGAALARSLVAFADDIFMSGGGVEQLMSDPRLSLDPILAPIYGYEVPAGSGPVWVEPTEPRPGLLGQPGLLSLLALPDQSSPIRRGVFVRKQLLCDPVPNPPPNVNNTPPDPAPGITTRERFRVHTESPDCAECHALIDPVGFGFEAYDELGRYRTEEDGLPIDTSGSLDHTPDPLLEGSFTNLNELAQQLSQGPTVLSCLGTKWFEFGLGRPPTGGDACRLRGTLEEADGSTPLSELVIAVVASPAFRYAAAPTPETTTP